MPDYLNRMICEALSLPPSIALSSIDDQGKYWITSDGRVLSVCGDQPQYLKNNDNGKGYKKVKLNDEPYYLHRLLAICFNKSQEKKKLIPNCEVHHLDRNKDNLRLDNLCIVSPEKHRAIHSIWGKIDKWEQQQQQK